MGLGLDRSLVQEPGSVKGQGSGMVKEPTVVIDKSLGWVRSLGGDTSMAGVWEGTGAWEEQGPGRVKN